MALGLVQPGDNLVTSQGDEIPQIATAETSQPGITMNTPEEEYKDVLSGLGCFLKYRVDCTQVDLFKYLSQVCLIHNPMYIM